MRIGVLEHPAGLSAYLGEILDAWGLCAWGAVPGGQLADLDPVQVPVLVAPAGALGGETLGPGATPVDDGLTQDMMAYARRGGAAVAVLPRGELAQAAGIQGAQERETPLRLRLAGPPLAGLAGESLPVVGPAQAWRVSGDPKSAKARLWGPTLAVVTSGL